MQHGDVRGAVGGDGGIDGLHDRCLVVGVVEATGVTEFVAQGLGDDARTVHGSGGAKGDARADAEVLGDARLNDAVSG